MTDPDLARRPVRLAEATLVLSRTPPLLDAWLRPLPPEWLAAREGAGTWHASDVVAHLIQGERTNWMPRLAWILAHGDREPFAAFAREGDARPPIGDLLDRFAALRAESLAALDRLGLTDADLDRPGLHPALGPVTLRNLLAAWVAHDLDHVTQIARVMARQYTDEAGAWRQYLRILNGEPI